jgi:hypothetical protein
MNGRHLIHTGQMIRKILLNKRQKFNTERHGVSLKIISNKYTVRTLNLNVDYEPMSW